MADPQSPDPYTEYQQILKGAKEDVLDNNFIGIQLPQTQTHSHFSTKIQTMAALQTKIVKMGPKQEPGQLIAGNGRERKPDQTMKRPSPSQFLSPQLNKNEQTKQDIRMKILIENKRLKTSIQTLKHDINLHKSNEFQIAQILKESKTKITTFKELVKDKSRKITQITENNIELKNILTKHEQKINQLNSYSIWQQNQIRQLKKELKDKFQQESQQKYLQQKIGSLEAVLKNYQAQMVKSQERSHTFSKESLEQQHEGENQSERVIQKWGTGNELELKDIQGLKQKQISNNEDVHEKYNQIINTLKNKMKDLEAELEGSKEEFKTKEEKWRNQNRDSMSKIDGLEQEVSRYLKKSLSLDEKILQNDEQIGTLKKLNEHINEELNKIIDQRRNDENKHTDNIIELTSDLDLKKQKIEELTHLIEQNQYQNKKYIAELEHLLSEKQENYQKQMNEAGRKINDLQNKNNQLEGMLQQKNAKIDIIQSGRLEEQNFVMTGKFYEEKVIYESEMKKISFSLEHFQKQNEELRYHLVESQNLNKHLEQQKNGFFFELDNYSKQIQYLKSVINNLSKPEKKIQSVIQELEEESDTSSHPEVQILGRRPNGQESRNSRVNNQSENKFATRPLQEQQQLSQEEDGHRQRAPKKFDTMPLEELEELQDEERPGRRTSRRSSYRSSRRSSSKRLDGDSHIEVTRLRKQNEMMERQYQQKLEKILHDHKLELVELQFQYEQEKEFKQDDQVKQLTKLNKKLENSLIQKQIEINIREEQFQQFKVKINELQNMHQSQIKNLKVLINSQTEQIKSKNQAMMNLQITFEKQKFQSMQISQKMIKLQEESKILHSEKLKLLESKVQLENNNEKLKYDFEMVESNKELQYSKKMEQIKSQLKMEIGHQYQEESKLHLSQQLVKKQKQIQVQSQQKIKQYQIRIGQLMKNIQKLNQDYLMMSHENSQTKRKYEDLERVKKQLEEKLQKQDEKSVEYEELLGEKKEVDSYFELQKEKNQEIIDENQRLKSEINVLTCQVESQKAQINTSNSKILLLENEVKTGKNAQKDRQDLLEKIDMYEKIIDEQKSQLNKQFTEKQTIITTSLKHTESLNEISTKSQMLEQQNHKLAQEIEELKDSITHISSEKQKLVKQMQQLLVKNQFLNKEFDEIQNEKEKLEIEVNQAKTLTTQKAQIVAEQENQMNNLRMSLQLSQTQHSAKVTHLVSEKQSQMSIKIRQIQNLKNIIEEMKQKMIIFEREQKQMNDKFDAQKQELEREKEILTSKNGESNARIQELQQSNFSFSSTARFQKEQLQQKIASLTDLEEVVKKKELESQQHQTKVQDLEEKIKELSKEWELEKQAFEENKKELEDNLQISRRMAQEMEDEQELKINKINKELSNYKILLEEAQKENSSRVEQSTRSLNNLQNDLKMKNETIKQKEEEIKAMKENQNKTKEELEKLKINQQRATKERQNQQKQKEENILKVESLTNQLEKLKEQLKNIKEKEEELYEHKHFSESEINSLKSKVKQLEMYNEHHEEQKQKIRKEKQSVEEQMNKIKQDRSKAEQKLKQMMIEKKKLEYQVEVNEQNLTKTRELLKTIELQKEQEMSSSAIYKQKTQNLEQDKQNLNSLLNNLEKQHLNKVENLKMEQREHYLQMERKYSKEMDELCEQLNVSNNQKDGFKQELQKLKKGQKQLKDEIQFLQKKIKRHEQSIKQFDTERGQYTDKILQLTQQNNQFTELVENLRNDVMSKNDQLFEYKEQLEKNHEQFLRMQQTQKNSASDVQNHLVVSIDTDKMALEEMIERLEAINRQLLTKNEIVQSQLNEKIRIERQLTDKLENIRQRQNRDRRNSSESYISRSKIFTDQKNQNIQNQLENYKLKLQSAQAYISQLQEEVQFHPQDNLNNTQQATFQKKIQTLEAQKEDLKMKIDYQQAYIEHLESDNIKASIVSKKSEFSKNGNSKNNDKEHSMSVSKSNRYGLEDQNLIGKVKMISQFIESYKKDENALQREEEFRKKLNNVYLDELLNTIFYRLQRDSNILKEKQFQISELELELQQFQEEVKNLRQTRQILEKKLDIYGSVENKYEQTKKILEDSLMLKMKQEQELAESRRYIEQLQRKNSFSSQELKSADTIMIMSSSKKQKGLSVLKQENQEESEGSLMSADADSQIPSEVYKSKQMKQKQQNPKNILEVNAKKMSKTVSIEGYLMGSRESSKPSIQFLSTVLDQIDKIENEVAFIQIQLEEKGEVLGQLLGAEQNKSQIVHKLQQLESKVCENDKDMNNLLQKSETELIGVIKELLKYRESQDSYGLQNESRRKIQQYLTLLQIQFSKSSKTYEQQKEERQERSIERKRESSPNKLKMSLQSIKEDILNEDKGSSVHNSIMRPIHSHSNSQGVEFVDLIQIKKENQSLLRQVQQLQEDVTGKEDIIKSISHRVSLISTQVGNILDNILMNFEQNPILFDQFQNIKTYLSKILSEQPLPSTVNINISPSQSGKMILIESKKNVSHDSIDKNINHFEQLLKMETQQFDQKAEQMTNEQVKQLQKKFQEINQNRYEDCIDFLNSEESLILDILKIPEEDSEHTMGKLAHIFTRDQISHIITNSHNKNQARKILTKVLSQQAAKSEGSAENDFSPDPQKMKEIRERIFAQPTELSLSLHNHLIQILAAPTRQLFYDLIQQLFKTVNDFQNQIKEEIEEIDSCSRSNSMRMKKMLQDSYQNLNFNTLDQFSMNQLKNVKNRSSSCKMAVGQDKPK